MAPEFELFGPAHLLILSAVPSVAVLLAWRSRRSASEARRLRLCLGGFLMVNELVWYAYRLRTEGFRFPDVLPLHLCDLALWLTILAAFTLRKSVFEVAYFAGVGGSSMAILTPDLWAPLCSYPSIYFFLAHGFAVITLLFLVWSKSIRPRPSSLWRVFLILNGYAAFIGVFNLVFHTNYMYLCEKPESASLLDLMGPWPVYIVAGELVASAVFALLWLPFRRPEVQ